MTKGINYIGEENSQTRSREVPALARCWESPPEDCIKLNFDGSFSEQIR